MRVLILITVLLVPESIIYSQAKRPAVYVDKGACPFECCTYRKWKTERTTIVYARPDRRSRQLGKLQQGDSVLALTGEVRTVPGRFVITKVHGKYKAGDVLWVYTPLGEGFYKVWFKGKMYEEALDYMSGPFEQSFPHCEETVECWGKLEKDLKTEWWVQVKGPNGILGWTDQADNFSNKDACG